MRRLERLLQRISCLVWGHDYKKEYRLQEYPMKILKTCRVCGRSITEIIEPFEAERRRKT